MIKKKKKQQQQQITPISEIGEFGLIDRIQKILKTKNKSTLKGIGDDCAVIRPDKTKETLISTDLLVEGVHFDRGYMSLMHIGYKSVIVNLSDIYAMNATPKHITISLAISNKYTVEDIEDLYRGISIASEKHKIDVIGGDVSSSYSGLLINIATIGTQKLKKIVYRSGAKDGDLIVTSGDLGAAYLGLKVLEREKVVLSKHKAPKFALPDIEKTLDEYRYLIQRQIKPEAKPKIIELLDKNKIKPTAMIDVSDGLVPDLNHLSKESGVGYAIYESKLPISRQAHEASLEFNINPLFPALYGGEDYELLFTVNPKYKNIINNLKDLTIIGVITKKTKKKDVILEDGRLLGVEKGGWDHFNI